MCNKVDARIECEKCGYPFSEARWPDDYDAPLDCDAEEVDIVEHIRHCKRLEEDISSHPYDCKCIYCR